MTDNTLTYRDHRISLNHEFKFNVSGPMMKGEHHSGLNTFASVEAAKTRIDELLKIAGVKSKRKLALEVLDADTGEVVTVHGIHSAQGHILGMREVSSYSKPDALPNVPWIAALIEEKRRLQERIGVIHKALKDYTINSSRGYRIKNADEYERKLKELEDDHAEVLKLARETNDQMPVEYPPPPDKGSAGE